MLNQTQFLELFHQRTGASAGFVLMVAHVSRKDSSQLQRGVLAFWPCSAFQRKPVWVRGPGGRTLRDNIKQPRELQLWKELWSCILSEFPLIPVFLFPCSPLLAANWLFFRTVSVHSFPQCFLFFFFYLPHPPFRTSPPISHLVFLIFPLSSFIPASLFLSTSFSMLLISGKKQTKTTGRRKLHFFLSTRVVYFVLIFSRAKWFNSHTLIELWREMSFSDIGSLRKQESAALTRLPTQITPSYLVSLDGCWVQRRCSPPFTGCWGHRD